MTAAPGDLLAFRTTVMRLTGLVSAADVGIVGDGAHARTGGYHEGKDVLTSIGRYHPGAAAGATTEDYSARLTRDRAGLTNNASAVDIGSEWPRGGRAAWLRFGRMVVAELRAGGMTAIRAVNYSPDGTSRLRVDRQHGWADESTTDSVTIHIHIEWYRDTDGHRQGSLDRLAEMIADAIGGREESSHMGFLDDADAAKLAWRAEALVHARESVAGGGTQGEPVELVRKLNALSAAVARLDPGPHVGLMTAEDRAAIVAELAPLIPTAEQIAALVPAPLTAQQVEDAAFRAAQRAEAS